MSDITKIRDWEDVDGHERDSYGDWIWPPPPIYVESRVDGELRAKILANLGHPLDSTATVRIIEAEIEGGYSEYTVEMDYGIEVWVDERGQSQLAFDSDYHYNSNAPMAAFLKWVEGQ